MLYCVRDNYIYQFEWNIDSIGINEFIEYFYYRRIYTYLKLKKSTMLKMFSIASDMMLKIVNVIDKNRLH